MSSLYDFLSTPQHKHPLPALRLPLVDEYIAPFVNPHVPAAVQAHLHLLIATILGYQAIFTVSSFISPLLFPRVFERLSKKTKIDFHVHIVSMIQSFVILLLCIPCFIDPTAPHFATKKLDVDWQEFLKLSSTSETRVFGAAEYHAFIATLALGYFMWDTLVSLVYVSYFGLGFLIHGVMSAMVFYIGLNSFIQFYAPVFILFEISTPFLNFRWFALKIPGFASSTAQLINNAILILIFFTVRICYGWYQAAKLFTDFYVVRNDERFEPLNALIIMFGNLVLNVLNVYWFWRMIVVAYATLADIFSGTNSRDDKKKDI